MPTSSGSPSSPIPVRQQLWAINTSHHPELLPFLSTNTSTGEILMGPRLSGYQWIVVNSSAGKDSQAMLDYVVEQCDRLHVPRCRIVVAHADLGRVEWPGTRELAEEQARHYGLTFYAIC